MYSVAFFTKNYPSNTQLSSIERGFYGLLNTQMKQKMMKIIKIINLGIIAEWSRALVQNHLEWTVPSLNPGLGRLKMHRSWGWWMQHTPNCLCILMAEDHEILWELKLFQIWFYSAVFFGVLHRISPPTFLHLKIQLETTRFEPRTFGVPV